MKSKTIKIITISAILLNINTISYANPIKGENAFKKFRIEDYENVAYKINTDTTSKYEYHTNAWINSIEEFSNIYNSGIGFIRTNNTSLAKITFNSTNSSKEEWLGLSKVEYNIDQNKPYGSLIDSNNYLNNYSIKAYDLKKEHIYEVALHELGHSFGLVHQPQGYQNLTLMGTYLDVYSPTDGTLKEVDKYNLSYAYKSKSDWINHWANNEIKHAMDNNWVNKTDYFRPNDNISRAEFVKIFNKVFGLTKSSGKIFTDTINSWARDEIDIAVTNGVCNGKTKTEFKPDDPISREEAAVMISNYTKISDKNLDKISKYKDGPNVSNWSKEAVEGVLEKGYISGYSDNTFRPKDKISRAEAVVTLSRVK